MTTTTQYPPMQPPGQPAVPKNGAALASLILGIVSVVANVLLVPTILGVVFGIIGLTRSQRLGRRGMAIGGIVLSVVGAIVGIVATVLVVAALSGAAAKATAAGLGDLTPAPTVSDPDDGSSEEVPADLPEGYKAVTDDVWFKWGRTDTSNDFLTTRSATVIAPHGCHSLLLQANEYDRSGANVGTAIASASNLATGEKAKVKFSWSADDHVVKLKMSEATCV